MLTAIISLSVVVVLVIALHIYARYVLRRQARRRAAIRQLGLMVSQVEPPKTGLDQAVIASLPIFIFKRMETGDEREGEAECAVCLSILEDDEMARLLPNCKHTFHAECIDKWLSSQSTCPICRTEAEPRVVLKLCQPPVGGRAPTIAPPIAPPLEDANSTSTSECVEGSSSDGGIQPIQFSPKVNGSSFRLSSFRRMLSRERLSPRTQSCGPEEDIERQ